MPAPNELADQRDCHDRFIDAVERFDKMACGDLRLRLGLVRSDIHSFASGDIPPPARHDDPVGSWVPLRWLALSLFV